MTTTPEEARPASLRDGRTDAEPERLVSRTSDEAPTRLCLLEDEYAREILEALTAGPMRGRDLIETCDSSRPTVYRRIDRLEDAGFVTSKMSVDPDGHHCKEFRLARDRLTVTIENGAITVTAQPSGDVTGS